MGGEMAVAAPVLIPMHLWFSQSSPWGFWLFLALLSSAEAGYMYTYSMDATEYWYVAPLFILAIFVLTKPKGGG
jgi:hypothetical protein